MNSSESSPAMKARFRESRTWFRLGGKKCAGVGERGFCHGTAFKRILRNSLLLLGNVTVLGFSLPASGGTLGFQFGMGLNGSGGIANTSDVSAQIFSVSVLLPESTFFDTAVTSPGTAFSPWSVIASPVGGTVTLPDSQATDGQRSAMIGFSGFDPGEYSHLGFDIDLYANPDVEGSPPGTVVQVIFSSGRVAAGSVTATPLTIGGITYNYSVTAAIPASLAVFMSQASNLTRTTATLNGTVSPNGLPTTAQFEYGTNTAYGSTAVVTLSPNNGTATQNVSAALSGLQPGLTYHYRLTATDGVESVATSDATFTTLTPGNLIQSFNAAANSTVLTCAQQQDGKLIVSGQFTTIGSVARNRIARLNADGSLDMAFNPDAGNAVHCIAVLPDGKIIIGGTFTTLAGAPRSRLARLNSDGTVDTSFNAQINDQVWGTCPLTDGRIIIWGNFYFTDGMTAFNSYVARLNTDGSLDTAFNPGPDDFVFDVTALPDGKLLMAGNFQSLLAGTGNGLVRLNQDGTVDAGFTPGIPLGYLVTCVALQPDGRMIIGGHFTSVHGVTRNGLARLNADGSLDATYNPDISPLSSVNTVVSLALQADGRLIVGGTITGIGGQTRTNIARLNSDGTVDAAFNPVLNGWVRGLLVRPDSRLLIVGQFTTVNGANATRIALLENDLPSAQLSVPSAAQARWLRGLASPEAQSVYFDLSTDNGASWTPQGSAARIAGGWELGGLSLPASGHIRARAQILGGRYNGSPGWLESISSFNLSGTTPIESWRQLYFGTTSNSGNSADTFDFDGDGLLNLIEFGFGLNPTLGISLQLPQAQRVGGNYVISFIQPAGVSGITYGAEWSTVLTNNPADWTSIADSDPSPTGYTFSVPIAGTERVFMRLTVTGP